MANRAPNPYVGPRAFEEGDHMLFFGREEETRQLASLVIARSAVLLYAPSGAGKTSLLKAGLIPYLQERKKLILLPVTRVGGDLPREVDGASVDNIYVFNALLNLVSQAAEPDAPVDPSLIGMSLKAGLKHHFLPRPDGDRERIPPHLLILDQFEELFTTHPGRYEDRDDFFSQLQDCLIPQAQRLVGIRSRQQSFDLFFRQGIRQVRSNGRVLYHRGGIMIHVSFLTEKAVKISNHDQRMRCGAAAQT